MIADATASRHETARRLLTGIPSPITLRELIRLRVREEVARYNADPGPRYSGLVQPVDAEVALNAPAPVRRRLDWE